MGRRALSVAIGIAVAVTAFAVVPESADAVSSVRDYKCMTRADRYANDSHPGVPAQELADRIAWLYSQCQQNRDAEAVAEEQGSMAEALFPNTADDRHAHPLHCMSLNDNRFGMHTEHDSPNPPDDPNGPGGAAAVNITGEFMYAWIDDKPRFLARYVLWTIDDRDGNVLSPVRIHQHPTYMGTPATVVASIPFANAYKPVSIWVEMPDTMAVANNEFSGILPGRRLTVRAWMESHCHDKRDPTVIPQMLIDRMMELGWQDSSAAPREPRAIRFKASGPVGNPSSWSLQEVPVTLPTSVNSKSEYRWFYDAGVVYNGADQSPPSKPANLSAIVKGSQKVRLEWNASTDNKGVAGYYVLRNGKRIAFTTNTFFVAKNLWPETQYSFKVRAVDTSGNKSVFSRVVRPTTKADKAPPTKPQNVTVSDKSKTSLTIEWSPASDNIGVSHYVIRLDGTTIATTTGLSYTITGLERNTQYHVAVRAVDVFDNRGKLVHRHPTTRK